MLKSPHRMTHEMLSTAYHFSGRCESGLFSFFFPCDNQGMFTLSLSKSLPQSLV